LTLLIAPETKTGKYRAPGISPGMGEAFQPQRTRRSRGKRKKNSAAAAFSRRVFFKIIVFFTKI
jgi:hypothetical protein